MVAAAAAWGDNSRLGGPPITPYGIDPKVGEVEAFKADEGRKRHVSFTIGSGTRVTMTRVKLAYVKGSSMSNASYKFSGRAEGRAAAYDFSQVRSFKLVGQEAGDVVVSLRVFPDIEPVDLLKDKPSYTDLKKREKVVELRLSKFSRDGGVLSFVGDSAAEKPFSLAKLPVDQQIDFDSGEQLFWWTTPSVVADEAYPTRGRVNR